MKIPFQQIVRLLFVMVVTISGAGCSNLTTNDEKQLSVKESTYLINAPSLLNTLRGGNLGAFTLQEGAPTSTLQVPLESVSWNEEDYYFIAQSFFHQVLTDSVDNWFLNKMFFKSSCNSIGLGFQQGSFTFNRTKHFRENESRMMRYLHISPSENEIYLSEAEFYPLA